jgi:low affinity Fe/Cu permease
MLGSSVESVLTNQFIACLNIFFLYKEHDMKPNKTGSWFTRFAKSTAVITGKPATFMVAVGVIVVWSMTGPFLGFSDTWQLVINTSTTIVTFLMVFLIQNTQNRDAEAAQIKLDELLRVTQGAHNRLMSLEELDEKEFNRIRAQYMKLAKRSETEVKKGKKDTGKPKV